MNQSLWTLITPGWRCVCILNLKPELTVKCGSIKISAWRIIAAWLDVFILMACPNYNGLIVSIVNCIVLSISVYSWKPIEKNLHGGCYIAGLKHELFVKRCCYQNQCINVAVWISSSLNDIIDLNWIPHNTYLVQLGLICIVNFVFWAYIQTVDHPLTQV